MFRCLIPGCAEETMVMIVGLFKSAGRPICMSRVAYQECPVLPPSGGSCPLLLQRRRRVPR